MTVPTDVLARRTSAVWPVLVACCVALAGCTHSPHGLFSGASERGEAGQREGARERLRRVLAQRDKRAAERSVATSTARKVAAETTTDPSDNPAGRAGRSPANADTTVADGGGSLFDRFTRKRRDKGSTIDDPFAHWVENKDDSREASPVATAGNQGRVERSAGEAKSGSRRSWSDLVEGNHRIETVRKPPEANVFADEFATHFDRLRTSLECEPAGSGRKLDDWANRSQSRTAQRAEPAEGTKWTGPTTRPVDELFAQLAAEPESSVASVLEATDGNSGSHPAEAKELADEIWTRRPVTPSDNASAQPLQPEQSQMIVESSLVPSRFGRHQTGRVQRVTDTRESVDPVAGGTTASGTATDGGDGVVSTASSPGPDAMNTSSQACVRANRGVTVSWIVPPKTSASAPLLQTQPQLVSPDDATRVGPALPATLSQPPAPPDESVPPPPELIAPRTQLEPPDTTPAAGRTLAAVSWPSEPQSLSDSATTSSLGSIIIGLLLAGVCVVGVGVGRRWRMRSRRGQS